MPPNRSTPRTSWAAASLGLLIALPLVAVSPATADDPRVPSSPDLDRPARKVDRNFKLGTLNILGSNHTRGKDRRRTYRTAKLIRRERLRLVAMQEVQQDQLEWLRTKLPRYRFWPRRKYGAGGIRLQIAWRRSRFDKLGHGTITTPFGDHRRPIPWVRLRDEQTGTRIHVINVHNSAGDLERDRDRATRKQIRLFNRLDRRRGTTLILGDANERREWFCRVTGNTAARAANGGKHTRRRCTPPEPAFLDWLMGAGHFGWRGYDSEGVDVSDHPLHTAVLNWG